MQMLGNARHARHCEVLVGGKMCGLGLGHKAEIIAAHVSLP